MKITNVDQDTASIHLYQSKDNVNDAIYNLTNETSLPSVNALTSYKKQTLHPSPIRSSSNDCVDAVFDSGASAHYV